MKSREKKGYALKRERGLVPHIYDKNSRRFHQGAWKNWTRRELEHDGANADRLRRHAEVMTR